MMVKELKRQLLTTFYTYAPLVFKISLQPPAKLATQPHPVQRKH
jgi:hypothetical protein